MNLPVKSEGAIHSWGNVAKGDHFVLRPSGYADLEGTFASLDASKSILAHGAGRSYGDSCLNFDEFLLSTKYWNHFLAFDSETGVLRCESGVTIAEILQSVMPRGWFIPVTPGTKFVTIGGALANDVHGKNHHRDGTIGRHITRFELLRSDGTRMVCSPSENADYFAATIGGLGLTGIILWVEIQLKRVCTHKFDVETIQFHGLDEFLALSRESDESYEYTVSWIDCVTGARDDIRGLFMRGNHLGSGRLDVSLSDFQPKLPVPVNAPAWLLSKPTISLFNTLFYGKQLSKRRRTVADFNSFFYPLDILSDWYRLYGKRGFFQFQCTIPFDAVDSMRQLFRHIKDSGNGSFLVVLKTFGTLESPGVLSYPSEGITLALDFANDGLSTRSLIDTLGEIAVEAGGRLYPAKDSIMTPEHFKTSYPQWTEFLKFKDPKLSSTFWRRVTDGIG